MDASLSAPWIAPSIPVWRAYPGTGITATVAGRRAALEEAATAMLRPT